MDNSRLVEWDKEIYSTGTSNSSKNHIFMIGIDKYLNDVPQLRNAVRDVDAIYKVLHEKYLFDGKHIILKDEFATRKNIYNAFYDYLNILDEDDNLIIYYAGHSYVDKKHKDAFWIPCDAFKGHYDTYIDTDFIHRKLRQIKAKHILLISDSCYSYGLFSDVGNRNAITKIYGNEKNRSRYGFYSGRGEVSDGHIHSPFARVLLDYLAESYIEFYTVEMYLYMLKKMWILGIDDQEPKYQVIPNTLNDSGEFVFRLREANEEIYYWRKILETPTIESCESYLKKYGDTGNYSEKVYGEIYKIKDRAKVNEIWDKTLKTNTIEAYSAFMQLYAYHSLSEDASKKIALLKRKERKKQDDMDWESALILGTAEGFKEYLSKQPKGRHRLRAEEIITSLKRSTSSQKIDVSDSIEIFEFYASKNHNYKVNEKLELGRVQNQVINNEILDSYTKFYIAAQEFIKKYPDILLYSLICESIIKEHIPK